MELNVPLRVVPTNVTAVMITTAINAAIRPYSMAVTPDSSLAKREIRVFMPVILGSRFKQCHVGNNVMLGTMSCWDMGAGSRLGRGRFLVWAGSRLCGAT